jgi:NADPH:quinone reductase-like Zn-dependent oxidoreductase
VLATCAQTKAAPIVHQVVEILIYLAPLDEKRALLAVAEAVIPEGAYLGDGSFAEYVTVPTTVGIAKLPENVSFTDGAAVGLAGAAAHGIIDAAALQPGQTLLVAGATGGVGTQVLQLAAAAGARVIATAHTDAERELVSRLGADVVVDHQADLAAQVRAAAPGGVDHRLILAFGRLSRRLIELRHTAAWSHTLGGT